MLKEKILRLSPAFALAFMVAASGISSQALAETDITLYQIHFHDDDDGNSKGRTEIWKDKDGNVYFFDYDKDGNRTRGSAPGNPKPDGGDSGIVDVNALIEDAMKNGGSEIGKENHFLESTLGQNLIKHSKTGSIVPVHNPDPGSFLPGDGGGYGGGTGGGFDPNNPTSIVDQMKKGKKKGKNKGKKKGKAPKPGYNFSANPALVNPVPLNLPVAKPGKKKVQHVPAPALIKKGKGPIGNLTNYPDIPNLPSPTAATNQNRRSGFNTALGMQPRAAVGNSQAMRGLGGSRRGGSHR